jgi:drug/metabolite transporter (DMT)-like permease
VTAPAGSAAVAAPARQNRPIAGIAVMLAGVVLGTCMDAALKFAVVTNGALQTAVLRSAFLLVLAVPLIVRAGGLAALRTRRKWGHALRMATALCSTLCFLAALARLPLATAIAVGMSAPLFMTVFSVPLLREHVGIHRWGAVVVGFAGVLVVTRPGVGGSFDLGTVFALGAAVFFALSMVTVRWLSSTETDISMMFYVNVGSILIGAVGLPLVWVPPTGFELAMIALGAALMLSSQMLTIRAFRLAPVGVLSPFYYTEVVWAALLGWTFWHETVEPHIWLGSAIIVASGLYTLWREQRAARGGVTAPA